MDSFFTHVHTNVNKSVAIAWVWSGYELSAWESAMLFPVVVMIQLYVLSQFENQQHAKITTLHSNTYVSLYCLKCILWQSIHMNTHHMHAYTYICIQMCACTKTCTH